MSLASDLASAFAEVGATVPVRLGSANARGFLDSQGNMFPLAGNDVQFIGTTLYLIKDSVPGLVTGASIQVGALGATALGDTPTQYKLGRVAPIEDGLILACECGGGR